MGGEGNGHGNGHGQAGSDGDDRHAAGRRGFEAVGRFLQADGWHPQLLSAERSIYRVGFGGQHGEYLCYAHVRVDLQQLLFYAIAPDEAPDEARGRVAEFLTRANYGLHIGNFEMDYDDGELRYKSSLDFEGVELDSRLIRNAIYPAVLTLDRYLPGLREVIEGRLSPREAIRQIEGKDSDAAER